jgi:hypothetical protein
MEIRCLNTFTAPIANMTGAAIASGSTAHTYRRF